MAEAPDEFGAGRKMRCAMKKIQILGTGCPKCKQLAANAEAAVRELGLDVQVEKVTDLKEIMGFGVMTTPALALDGQVIWAGKVATVKEIRERLR